MSGALSPLVDPEDGAGPTLNDGRCDAAGRFWCGSCDPAEVEPLGLLFRLDPDGSVHRMAGGLIVSNGIDWSPDGRVMYHTDSGTGRITAYDHDPATGAIERPRTFVQDDDGVPDGLLVDAEGCIWSAKWDGWRVVRYAPDGTIERTLPVPAQRPTALALGGPDLRTLYVTTARYDLDAAALREQPLAGRTLVQDVDVRGRPTALFGG